MARHPALQAAVLAGALAAGAAWLARRYVPAVVAGQSMSPTLEPNDRLIVALGAAPAVGDVVVARRHDGLDIVKRVRAIRPEGFDLAGDNPDASTDSRSIGLLAREQIVGVVKAVAWPAPRLVPRRAVRR